MSRRRRKCARGMPDVERFWAKTVVDGRCIVWNQTIDRDGYGRFTIFVDVGRPVKIRRQVRAARWIYEQVHGALDPDVLLLHECDNPRCVTLQHMSTGSQRINIGQMLRRGRLGRRARLTPAIVLEVRRRRADGESVRSISRSMLIDSSMVSRIARRLAWAHIP